MRSSILDRLTDVVAKAQRRKRPANRSEVVTALAAAANETLLKHVDDWEKAEG